MTITHTAAPTFRKPPRLWPGVVLATLQCLGSFVLPVVMPESPEIGKLGALACGMAIILWWVLFSRVPWRDRWGAVVLMVVALYATSRGVHVSIATGAMGMLFPILVIPPLSLALVGWAVATRRLADGPRRVSMVMTILLACGGWLLARTGGFTGGLEHDLAWRWTQTAEERLVARAGDEPAALPASEALAETGAEWPGYRGPDRDGIVRGVRIETDWAASPPIELWRRSIGPGWSSFAVQGDLIYTQEQRGDDEVVACYKVTTGEPVWMHRDRARFWESNAGAGPRGTPTLSGGRVYTFGGTGIVNALDAGTGAVVWSRNAAADTKAKVPTWGFSSSPLVIDDVVIVAASGALAAYDLATGEPRWDRPPSGAGYSSPHLMTIQGVAQVVQLNGKGAIGVTPTDGTVLWESPWEGYPIVQPAQTAEGDVLISVSSDSGIRRLAIMKGTGGWTVEERWTSLGLKPYFNDFVVHKGHAYGFDGRLLACINLEDGTRTWKGGRYGNGQLILLPDQDVMLVLSEKGELALVGATPEKFTEIALLPAIKGKTWNHPVLAGDVLLVRNGEEMAAFRLSLDGR